MTIGPLKRLTKRFNFNIINFGFPRWHQYDHDNWDTLDAILATYVTQSGLKGLWRNATQYEAGDRAIDEDEAKIYIAQADHLSPATGSFADARLANATLWRPVTYDPENRGEWAPSTIYGQDDFVVYEARYAIVKVDHISSTNFQDDVDDGNLHVLIDAQVIVAAANEAAAAAEQSSIDASLILNQVQEILAEVQQIQENVEAQDLSPYLKKDGTVVMDNNAVLTFQGTGGIVLGNGGVVRGVTGETRITAASSQLGITRPNDVSYLAVLNAEGQLTGYTSAGLARTYWNSLNDGAGSGLDADLLDGYNLEAVTTNANTVVGRTALGGILLNGAGGVSMLDAANGTVGLIYNSSNTWVFEAAGQAVGRFHPSSGLYLGSQGSYADQIVSEVRLGAVSETNVGAVGGNVSAGRVVTGIVYSGGSTILRSKPLQARVGGSWATVSG